MKRAKKTVFGCVMGICIMINSGSVYAKTASINKVPEWNGGDAAAYAKVYAYDYNKEYYKFSRDCTNFASQSVLAGKSMMDGADKKEAKKNGNILKTSSKWYYLSDGSRNKFVCTTSWCRCSGKHSFANYWNSYNIGAFKSLKNVRKNVAIGDVIQITLKDGTYKHSIIVTEIKNGEVYCASHTGDYSTDALADINKRAKKSWGEVKYTIFHFGN